MATPEGRWYRDRMVRKARIPSVSFAALFGLATLLAAAPAAARSQRDLPWTLSQTWTAAIRLLRLDLEFPITERDQDAGFILFQYVDGEHRTPGSLEIVERPLPDGRAGVRVVLTLSAQPSYIELHVIDRLERKLRDEVGEPLAPRPTRPTPPPREEEEDRDEAPEGDGEGSSDD